MYDDEIYHEARKKVKRKKGFFYHLIAYIGVLAMLSAILFSENNKNMMPVIVVALTWGIGLASHYFGVFGTEHLSFLGFNPHWEEDELEMEMERLTRKRELQEKIIEEESLLESFERLELKALEKRKMEERL